VAEAETIGNQGDPMSRPAVFKRGLTIFFALALAINLGFVAIGLASVPGYYQRVTTQAVEPFIVYGQTQFSNEIAASRAIERGLSLQGYALYKIVFNVTLALIPTAVALLIVWRARWQWFASYSAFVIVFLGGYALNEQMMGARLSLMPVVGFGAIFWFLMLPYFYLFPNGQPVPRGVLWFEIVLVLYHLVIQVGTVLASVAPGVAAAFGLPNWGQGIYVLPVLFNFVLTFASQVYRYRRVSTPVERQQTKWFLYGFALIIVSLPIAFLVRGQDGYVKDLTADSLFTLVLPLSLAIGILRYRLWDIDVIIRRTLIYTVLTGLLVLAYFGSVLALEGVFRALTGQGQNSLVVVLSTLAIAALFGPVRGRVQAAIDKRFFRKKYDAARTLAGYAASARDETDLERLSARLVSVVDETMQPAQVSLWLRPNRRGQANLTAPYGGEPG
jgi:hypothetical protein